ncbi:hypothetical protein D9M72_646750 [compost metagenome]
MHRTHLCQHRVHRRSDDQVGKIGKGAARLRARDRTGQQADTDEEPLLGGDDTQPVEHLFIVAAASHEIGDARRQIVPGR